MIEIEDTAKKISPGSDRGLLKRVERETGIRYETLVAWKNRGLPRLSYPALLLWSIFDVLADDGTLFSVIDRARKRIPKK